MTEVTGSGTLAAMTAEVTELARAQGQDSGQVSFGEAMAALHSRVSRTLDAWQRHGLEDVTEPRVYLAGGKPGPLTEPRGTGAGFAGILIALLDAAGRFGTDLDDWVALHAGRYAVSTSFGENMDHLHNLICEASEAATWIDDEYKEALAAVYVFTTQLCEFYGIGLAAEYERVTAYCRDQVRQAGATP
jgi:hypothetical protein